MIFLEATSGEPYLAIYLIILFIIAGVPVILGLISIPFFLKKKNKMGKILLIIAGVYLLISLGVCSTMI